MSRQVAGLAGLRETPGAPTHQRETFPEPLFLRGRALAVTVIEDPAEPPLSRLVPLWLDVWDAQRQRQQALAATAAGWADPGYTYPGAHALPAA